MLLPKNIALFKFALGLEDVQILFQCQKVFGIAPYVAEGDICQSYLCSSETTFLSID